MPAEQKVAIQNALNETFSADLRIQFETAPDAVCGIELTSNGQKIAWSIVDYLASLDQKVGVLLDTESPSAAKPSSQSGSAPAPQPVAPAEAK
jgi:F-type H+-transporting ATPase subunit b